MSPSTKIRIKFLKPYMKKDEEYILNILNDAFPEVLFIDIFVAPTQVTLTLNDSADLPTLLSVRAKTLLAELELELIPPPSYYPSITVFANKVKPFISDKNTSDLLNSINNHLKNEVKATSVTVIQHRNYKDGDSKSLKIVFNTPADADKALNSGFHIHGLFHHPEHLSKETFIEITQCFRCFSYGHFTNQCKAPNIKCSSCSGAHHFTQCTATKLCCPMCGGEHKAIAMACPKRREQLASLKEKAKVPSTSTPTTTSTPEQSSREPPAYSTTSDSSNANNPSHSSSTNPLLTQNPLGQWANRLSPKHNNNPPPTLSSSSLPNPPPPVPDPTLDINSSNDKPSAPSNLMIRMSVYEKIADRMINGDENAFLFAALMNDFLEGNGIEPIDFLRMAKVVDSVKNIPPSNNATSSQIPESPKQNNSLNQSMFSQSASLGPTPSNLKRTGATSIVDSLNLQLSPSHPSNKSPHIAGASPSPLLAPITSTINVNSDDALSSPPLNNKSPPAVLNNPTSFANVLSFNYNSVNSLPSNDSLANVVRDGGVFTPANAACSLPITHSSLPSSPRESDSEESVISPNGARPRSRTPPPGGLKKRKNPIRSSRINSNDCRSSNSLNKKR